MQQGIVEAHVRRKLLQLALASRALRLRRCCRSLKGATSPSRTTSSSPSSTASKSTAADDIGKGCADVVAACAR